MRLAQDRAIEAEDYAAENRIAAAEKRAEAALLRAAEAESWLARFHDAIVEGFGSERNG